MANIDLVIKIPEEIYQQYKKVWKKRRGSIPESCIAFGIPLPKGHGDLVDRDEINGRFYDIWKELESYSNKPSQKELLDKWSMCMDTAHAIIEAANAESEG